MGGEDAEVGGETTDVLVEVANFGGRSILETSQRLGLRTDASSRFERNLDPEMVDYAMNRVTSLLAEYAGGRTAQDTLSHYPEPAESWEVSAAAEPDRTAARDAGGGGRGDREARCPGL